MEFKKKTIIWEDNNEPPKDYIWAKKDGKFYEYSYATRSWIESKLIKAEESEGSNEGGSEGNTPSGNIVPAIIYMLEDEVSEERTVHSIEESLANTVAEDLEAAYDNFKIMGYKEPPAECTISDTFYVE